MEICTNCGAYTYNNYCEDCGAHVEQRHDNGIPKFQAKAAKKCSRCDAALANGAWEICENCISFIAFRSEFCEKLLESKLLSR